MAINSLSLTCEERIWSGDARLLEGKEEGVGEDREGDNAKDLECKVDDFKTGGDH